MKERLVRGTNLRNVVRALRVHQREHSLPDIGPWEQELLRKRVSPSTWYSLAVFERLLAVLHRYVFDGSEASAHAIGRTFASSMIEANPAAFAAATPIECLSRLNQHWRAHFNFGEVEVIALAPEGDREGATIRLSGYPDMSATHGHSLVGWTTEIARHCGGQDVQSRIEERPWMHNSVLTYTLTWRR